MDEIKRRLAKFLKSAANLCEEAAKQERESCAQVCDDHASQLQAIADKYPAGTATLFVEEARELAKRIRRRKA